MAAKRMSSSKAKASETPATPTPDSPSSWTFLTNHAHVLILLSQNSSMVIRQVATQVGITERAVQRIIADLQHDGFIERAKVGRKNHYHISQKMPLRHPIEAHRTIGDLIKLITRARPE